MKQKIISFARKMHLLPLLEKIRLLVIILKTHPKNRGYVKNSPKKLYPPYSLMHDAYRHCSYMAYDKTGLRDAALIMQIIREFTSGDHLVICEFGCGPARIIRNLEAADPGIAKLIGTDYNPKTIQWCQKSVPEIHFIKNELAPPLDLPDHSLDVLYCISVFTHLSEEMHFKWIKEIRRVLKPGGLFIGSFHGDESCHKLLPEEKSKYLRGELVTRGNVKEGSRIYTAYHSDPFVANELLAGFGFVRKEDVAFGQTIWCAK